MSKNVLITGTSTGVGYEASLLFAQAGYKVYATMRNLDKAKNLREVIKSSNLPIEIIELDVTKTATIEHAVNKIIAQDGKIDILINNAGAGFAKTLEQATEDEIRWVTEVNYLGTVFCTQAVLPHMRESKSGRIINVTSVGGLVGQPFNELYCGAKFAVEGFTEGLASYVGPNFNIQFTAVEPGGIRTEFMNSAIDKTSVNGQFAEGEYQPIFEKYMAGTQERLSKSDIPLYQTGKEVAAVILEVAQQENPPLRIRTSTWAEQFCALKTQADPDGTKLVNTIASNLL
ncbi:SDR family oxidoreductase [Crocinitomix algicola]|uniref:SDR family oxidoreductase n=1 Tax=Crocinitomix algicola TaxID=1740263 RepID=UPI00082C7782|nr:SDR family oxidoreductase [Crocinitomix algicola]